MSKKIFSIVILLIVVAVVIMCLGLYSINTLNEQMESTGRLAQRSVAMNQMDRTMVERRLAIFTLINETEPDRINAANKAAQDTEPAFAAILARYKDNFPVPIPPEMASRANTIQKLWDDYVKVTDEVAVLGVQNTTSKPLNSMTAHSRSGTA
jgi:hypothetical protein